MDTPFQAEIRRARAEHGRLVGAFLDAHATDLARLAEWSAATLRDGGKLLLFGNGGSAAQAQHLAAELVNRLELPRRALAALALTVDGAVLSSVANDADFRQVFARQIEALGRAGDLALALSTSGASPNVVEGLRAAGRLGLRSAALLGRDGGEAAGEADLALVVPGEETARIQEVQLFAGHLLCHRIERLLGLTAAS
jgi:D-sedoheptulose 7-phosphate isomerase